MAGTAKKNGVAFYEGNSWYHRVKLLQADGTTKYSKRGGFSSEKEAEQSYYIFDEEYKKAYRAYQISHKVNSDIGFKDYLLYWFEDVYSLRIQNTTRMVGAYTLYDLILPQIEKDIKLKYLNVEYVDALLEAVSRICESAGNKSREFLNIAVKDAVSQGYIKTNPIAESKPYPRKKTKIIILGKEKIKLLLKAAEDNPWYLEILLALFCGLRKGEIQGLKFSDIDAERRIVSINRQITSNPIVLKGQSKIAAYEVEERDPKTENSFRMLKIPEAIMLEIEKRRELVAVNKAKYGDDYIDGDYISCQENGMPHAVSSFNNALTKLCKKNGLPHITVHGLRHMYATILLEQGVELIKISALLGHASVSTTFEFYCDQMDENEQIMSFMNNSFIPEGGD